MSNATITKTDTPESARFDIGSWLGGFLVGAAVAIMVINTINPIFENPKVDNDAKVCIAYEQTSGDCSIESTVGQVIEDARNAEANK